MDEKKYLEMEQVKEIDQESQKQNFLNEYNFIIAQNLTEKLLSAGLINSDEFNKISAKNREKYQPELGPLMD